MVKDENAAKVRILLPASSPDVSYSSSTSPCQEQWVMSK